VDFSKLILKGHRSTSGSPEYVAGSAVALPFQEGSFGALVSMSTLMFVQEPKRMVNEAFRVLRSEGRIVVDVSNRGCLYYGIIGRMIRFFFPSLPSLLEQEARKYSPKELRSLLEYAGFRITRIRYLLLPHRRFPYWLVLCTKLVAPFFEHGPLKRFSGILVAVADKASAPFGNRSNLPAD
jgi:ubiquinone/menaquinone biosynthesis C-methylase UbiE